MWKKEDKIGVNRMSRWEEDETSGKSMSQMGRGRDKWKEDETDGKKTRQMGESTRQMGKRRDG
jgi:hypothetical protein